MINENEKVIVRLLLLHKVELFYTQILSLNDGMDFEFVPS